MIIQLMYGIEMNILCYPFWIVILQIIVIDVALANGYLVQKPSISIKSLLEDNCIFEYPKLRCKDRLSIIENVDMVTILEIDRIEWRTLDLDEILSQYPNVEQVIVNEGKVVSIVASRKQHHIKVLELKRLLWNNITYNFIENFPNLKVLNLSGNRFRTFSPNFMLGNLSELYLKDNQWNCSDNLDWVLSLNRNIVKDLDELTCYGVPYPGKPLLPIANYLKDLKATCLPQCHCQLNRVAQDITSDKLKPIISVNCSGQGFHELPQHLPKYTRILHLESNHIQNLEPLKTNRIYRDLWDLYLDYNEVTSIRVLEGSHWLSHFRAFSLKGNKLAKVPSYALDNALLRNPNMPIAVRLYLSENPWRCDCLFVPVFQELVLQKYSRQVKDIRDVKCSYVEGDENSLLPIVEVSRSSVCRLPNEYSLQEGLDLLNIVLASLIIFIFGKLLYDYYYFKKTGRLPWIVTKMP